MTRAMKWLTMLLAVSFLAAAGCGDDDDESSDKPEKTASSSSPAQACVDSWNAKANEDHHTSLAGIVSAVGLAPDELRMGTWPDPNRTVTVWSAENAFAGPTGEGTVATDSCVLVLPKSHQGDITYFAEEGKWQLVKQTPDELDLKFPAYARRSVAEAENATADALGKLTLN